MKRILALLMTIAMMMSVSLVAFAAADDFEGSPSRKPAPELVEGKPSDPDCSAEIVVVPYGDRDDLTDEEKALFEKAYNEIIGSTNITDLNDAIAELAKKLGVDVNDLAISDLFGIDYNDCDTHDGHGHFEISLKAESLNKFVGIMYFDGEKWVLVDDAKVNEAKDKVSFTSVVDKFYPYAVIVDTGAEVVYPPQTGDSSIIAVCGIVTAACGLALITVLKKKENQAV